MPEEVLDSIYPLPIEKRVPAPLPADRDPFGMNLAPLREKAEAENPASGSADNAPVLKALGEIKDRLDNVEKALFKLLLK